MGIGINTFLIAVGAILTFAVDATVVGLDINTVGIILMIAGVLGLILTLVVFAPRRRRNVTQYTAPAGSAPAESGRVVTTEEVSGTPLA